jgi:hypothetical protein
MTDKWVPSWKISKSNRLVTAGLLLVKTLLYINN